jgi:hypothetical protein
MMDGMMNIVGGMGFGMAARADTDEHLDEFGSRDRKEPDAGLTGDGPRQERLAGPGRPDEQDAFGNPRTEPAVGLRIPEKADHLRQFLLRLVDTRDVRKRDFDVLLGVDLCSAAADAHQTALTGHHRAHYEHPDDDKNDHRQQPGQQVLEQPRFGLSRKRDVASYEFVCDLGVDPHGGEVLGLSTCCRLPVNRFCVDGYYIRPVMRVGPTTRSSTSPFSSSWRNSL